MKKQLFILSFAMLSILSARATNLVVKPLSGADFRRELATIGKVVYHGDSLYLYDSFGTLLYAEALGNVQQFTYSEGDDSTMSMTDAQSDATTLRVYPNPTTSVLIMEVRSPGRTQEQSDQTARLYNQQGQLLKTTTLTTTRTTLDVSDLPAGTYLLLCEGGAFKVIVQ